MLVWYILRYEDLPSEPLNQILGNLVTKLDLGSEREVTWLGHEGLDEMTEFDLYCESVLAGIKAVHVSVGGVAGGVA